MINVIDSYISIFQGILNFSTLKLYTIGFLTPRLISKLVFGMHITQLHGNYLGINLKYFQLNMKCPSYQNIQEEIWE